MRRAGAAGVVAVVIGLAACGSSDDGDGDAVGTQAPVATASSVAPTAAPATSPAGGGGGGGGTTTPPEVGAVLLGTAVATVSGGDNPREQTGDVERVDQRCYGVGTLVGLAEGSPVAVRDLATGASLGAGFVEATSAVRLPESADGRARWDCSFPFRVELSAPATDVAVQIAGLPELLGTIVDGHLTVVVPNDVTSPKPPPPEDSQPDVSDPDVSEPAVSEPAVSEPAVSEPDVNLPGY
jgi:hypothetical protein